MELNNKSVLLEQANQIRTEVCEGKNTAERLGKILNDIISNVADTLETLEDNLAKDLPNVLHDFTGVVQFNGVINRDIVIGAQLDEDPGLEIGIYYNERSSRFVSLEKPRSGIGQLDKPFLAFYNDWTGSGIYGTAIEDGVLPLPDKLYVDTGQWNIYWWQDNSLYDITTSVLHRITEDGVLNHFFVRAHVGKGNQQRLFGQNTFITDDGPGAGVVDPDTSGLSVQGSKYEATHSTQRNRITDPRIDFKDSDGAVIGSIAVGTEEGTVMNGRPYFTTSTFSMILLEKDIEKVAWTDRSQTFNGAITIQASYIDGNATPLTLVSHGYRTNSNYVAFQNSTDDSLPFARVGRVEEDRIGIDAVGKGFFGFDRDGVLVRDTYEILHRGNVERILGELETVANAQAVIKKLEGLAPLGELIHVDLNDDWAYVISDCKNNVLWGIKHDGKVYCPGNGNNGTTGIEAIPRSVIEQMLKS